MTHKPDPKMDWLKLDWPKLVLAKNLAGLKPTLAKNGLAKIGQIWMAKTGLAKVGLFWYREGTRIDRVDCV